MTGKVTGKITAKEIIEKMQEISEKSGISLDDMYVKASIPTNCTWNEWKEGKCWLQNNFIITTQPFASVDSFIVSNPDVPFILELALIWDWLSEDEEKRAKYEENSEKADRFLMGC